MDLLVISSLAAHLMAMNVAAGGPLVGMWLEWKARNGRDPLAVRAADYVAKFSFLSLLVGGGLGVIVGALHWSESYRELWLVRLRHKAVWGLAELAVSLLVLGGYWLWRVGQRRAGVTAAVARMLLLLFAATNLLYHFPPLFLVASHLLDEKATAGAAVTPADFRLEMMRGEIPALTVHFVLASLAVTGVLILWLALSQRRRGGSDEDDARLTRWGGWIALTPSVLQLPVGLWVLSTVGPVVQNRMMGGNLPAASCFLIAVLAALWLMRELAAIALGERERSQLVKAMALMVTVIVLMTAGQHFARNRAAVSHQPSASWGAPLPMRGAIELH